MSLHLPSGIKNEGDMIDKILRESKTIAVVGLSSNPARPSYGVAAFLRRGGYRIIPVNPHETEVLGEKAYARLEDVPEKVDIVDVFRRAELLPGHMDDLLAMSPRPRLVWLQLGIRDDVFADRLAQAGITVVQDRCLMVELRRRSSKRR